MFLRLCLCFLLFAPIPAAAERVHAVLVGVGDYAYLDADLEGPVNDVSLMARALMARGVTPADMTVLADAGADVPQGAARGMPDRAAILSALTGAVRRAGQGDWVVFYFSGHGAQAPDLDGDEGGGLDEIFLPRDTKGWNGGIGAVENAIVDDELSAITALAAARGVRLVGIIDACHSGTGFRAMPERGARARYISPAQLSLPDAVEAAGVAAPAPPGDYVFLYAAQSDQRAYEYPVGETRVWHGDFTRALTTVMTEVRDLSWAGLTEAATARMQRSAGFGAQTPDVEGPLIDAPVFGGGAPGLARIAVEGRTLAAGLVRGITPGSTLTLFAEDGTEAGRARVRAAQALEATLDYLEPFPTARVTSASVTQRAVDTSVRLAVGADLSALGGVQAVAAFLDLGLDAADPTHVLVAVDDGFALVGPDGVLDAAGPGTSLRLPGGSAEALGAGLRRAVQRLRVEAALAQMQAGSGTMGFSLGTPAAPQVSFTATPGRARQGGRCAPPRGEAAPTTGTLGHCDVLTVDYHNATGKMQDVTLLYLHADHRVETIWPQRGLSNRIEPDGRQRMGFAVSTPGPVLRESLIVVSVPAEPGSMRTRLSFAGGAQGAAADYLATMTDPAQSRSLSLSPAGTSLDVQRLDLTISPISEGE
ncbi:MAG: caspase family protein [Pseudomonadota bacterium]